MMVKQYIHGGINTEVKRKDLFLIKIIKFSHEYLREKSLNCCKGSVKNCFENLFSCPGMKWSWRFSLFFCGFYRLTSSPSKRNCNWSDITSFKMIFHSVFVHVIWKVWIWLRISFIKRQGNKSVFLERKYNLTIFVFVELITK